MTTVKTQLSPAAKAILKSFPDRRKKLDQQKEILQQLASVDLSDMATLEQLQEQAKQIA